jgi:hypothetical protein
MNNINNKLCCKFCLTHLTILKINIITWKRIMPKKDTFLDSLEWVDIVNNVKGIMTSDGTMPTVY